MTVSGLLYSQVGYDLGLPMRAVVRGSDPDHVPEGARFAVCREPGSGDPVVSGEVSYWGETWRSHWWIVDFSTLAAPGSYVLLVTGANGSPELFRSEPFRVGENLVWDETVHAVAIEQFEERARLARNGVGWKDCGSNWRECNSHASAIIGLDQLLSLGYEWLSTDQVERIRAQLVHGCDYLAILQDTSESVCGTRGAFVHEIPNHLVLIPGDTAQSAVALAYSGRLLADTRPQKASEYIDRARRAVDYLLLEAQPYGGQGFSAMNHGAPEDFVVPDEFMTRDLAMMMWGCAELCAAGHPAYRRHAVRLAREVMDRQVPEERAEGGSDGDRRNPRLWGHFSTFSSAGFTEKANCHHHVGHDTGTTFPHFIAPMVDMARRWHDHPDAGLWRECVRRFVHGYLVPACRANPFLLLPEGYFAGEGLLSFCGPWHGINSSYGLAAVLALECMSAADPGDRGALLEIAIGNLQWICGLHAGITRRSFDGCVLWKDEVPDGAAVPYSQIFGVGRRWTGNWTGIRGTVPNGFDVNPQFQLAVKPSREVDAPLLYTDEDWIPHGAAFVAGLATLRAHRRFA